MVSCHLQHHYKVQTRQQVLSKVRCLILVMLVVAVRVGRQSRRNKEKKGQQKQGREETRRI
jgi:hypothetical protein